MPELRIDLIDRLESAAAAMREALDVMSKEYGLDDPLFDQLSDAARAADAMAERLQDRADTYGEMAHHGLA
jgi:hypothetical protein